MDKFLKLLASTDLKWETVNNGAGNHISVFFQGQYEHIDIDDDYEPSYRIYTSSKQNAHTIPVRLYESITVEFGSSEFSRTLSFTFNHFYEVLSYLNSEARKKVENWYSEDAVCVELNFPSIESVLRFLEGREIAKMIEPLRITSCTLDVLLNKTIGPRKYPETFSDFISELYETDGIPETFEESQDCEMFELVSILDVHNFGEDGMEVLAEVGLFLGENFQTTVEVTQVVNTSAPAYQIWFKMHEKTYFFGCEHSIFLY